MLGNLCKGLLFRRKIQAGNGKPLGKRRKVSGMRFLYIRYKYKGYRIKSSGRVLDFGLDFHQRLYDLGRYT